MKQKLKFPLIVLFFLFLVFLVIGLFLPGETNVSRSISIKSPPAAVMPHITSFKNWLAWMPWNKEMDPSIEVKREGPESGVGAIHTWTSKNSGNGKLKIIAVEDNVSMGYHCWFDGSAVPSLGSFDLDAEGDLTNVTWAFTVQWGSNPFMRYIGLMMSGMIEKDFDRGLAKLKEVVESTPYEPVAKETPPTTEDEQEPPKPDDEDVELAPADEEPPEDSEDETPSESPASNE